MQDSMVFYKSFFDAINNVNDKEVQLQVYKAIFEFSLLEQDPELDGLAYTLFILIKPQLVANLKRREDGKKGGRPKTNGLENENHRLFKEETIGLENEKPNVNVNVNVNDNVNANLNDNRAEEVMSLFNTTCLFMEPATMITPKRLSLITELLNGYGLDEIKEVFQKANSSDYLLGKNSKGWKASFDWIIDINNFVKIAEGNFENKVEKTSKMMNHNYDFEALEKDSKMAASKRAKEIDLKVLPKEEKPKDEKPVYKGDYEEWILECEEWERRKNDI